MAITPVWLTGFEHRTLSTAIPTSGLALFNTVTTSGTTVIIDTTLFRNGAASLKATPTGSAAGNVQKTITAANKVVVRFAFQITGTIPNMSVAQLFTFSYTTFATKTGFRTNGTNLQFSADGTTYQTGPAISAGQWYLVECQLDLTTNPWTFCWKVDGVAQTNATAANAADTVAIVRIGSTSTTGPTFTCNYDDVIVGTYTGTTGTGQADWFGDGRVQGMIPDSDGTHSVGSDTFRYTDNNGGAFTNITNSTTVSWSRIDDWPVTADGNGSDDWVDKSAGTGSGNYVEHGYAAPTAGTIPNAIMAIAAIRNDSLTAANNCDLRYVVGSTEHATKIFAGTIGVATTVYTTKIFTTQPGGTALDLAAATGAKTRFYSTDIAPVPRIKALMFEVDFPTLATATLSATGQGSSSIVKDGLKSLLATGTNASSCLRLASKLLSVTGQGSATKISIPSKILSVIGQGSAAITFIVLASRILLATGQGSAAKVLDISKTVSAIGQGSTVKILIPSRTLSVIGQGSAAKTLTMSRIFSSAGLGSAVKVLLPTRIFSSIGQGSSSLEAIKILLMTLSATGQGSAEKVISLMKSFSISTSIISQLRFIPNKVFSASSSPITSLSRLMSKEFSVSAISEASIITEVIKSFSVTAITSSILEIINVGPVIGGVFTRTARAAGYTYNLITKVNPDEDEKREGYTKNIKF